MHRILISGLIIFFLSLSIFLVLLEESRNTCEVCDLAGRAVEAGAAGASIAEGLVTGEASRSATKQGLSVMETLLRGDLTPEGVSPPAETKEKAQP